MTASSPHSFANSSPVTRSEKKPNSSRHQHGAKLVKNRSGNPHKHNVDFRDSSRRDDANLLWAAFPGHSQQAVAEKASRALGVTDRQVVNWLRLENDMPSWAVKAARMYVRGVEYVARKIEGQE